MSWNINILEIIQILRGKILEDNEKIVKNVYLAYLVFGGMEENKIDINKLGIPKTNGHETTLTKKEILDNASLCDLQTRLVRAFKSFL